MKPQHIGSYADEVLGADMIICRKIVGKEHPYGLTISVSSFSAFLFLAEIYISIGFRLRVFNVLGEHLTNRYWVRSHQNHIKLCRVPFS